MAPPLAPVALEREWVSASICTLSHHTGSSIPLLSAPPPYIFTHPFCLKTVGMCHLSMVTPTVVRVRMTTAASSAVPRSKATFSGTIQGAGMTVALSSLGQGSHQLDDLVLQLSCSLHWFSGHHGPCPYLVPGLLIFTLCFSGSYPELGI